MLRRLRFKSTSKVGTFSLVDTSPARAILPPKISVFRFSKVTFWSFIISLPDTLLNFKLSYNTVLAFAVSAQSKKAGTFIAASFVGVLLALGASLVSCFAGADDSVAGCIKSFTTNLFEDRLKFPLRISFLKAKPYRLSIVPVRCKSLSPVRASNFESPMCDGLKATFKLSIWKGFTNSSPAYTN